MTITVSKDVYFFCMVEKSWDMHSTLNVPRLNYQIIYSSNLCVQVTYAKLLIKLVLNTAVRPYPSKLKLVLFTAVCPHPNL